MMRLHPKNRTPGKALLFLIPLIIVPLMSLAQGSKGKLSISREIEKVGERQYRVTVKVKKGKLKGYAKLEEMIPKGFVASKEKTNGANYVFQDGKAKFIWMEFPEESEFRVVYKLIQKRSEAGTYTVDGRISCVSSDGKLLRVEKSTSFEVKAPKLASGSTSKSNGGQASGRKKGTVGSKKEKKDQGTEGEKVTTQEGGSEKGESEKSKSPSSQKDRKETEKEPEGTATPKEEQEEKKKAEKKSESEKKEPSWEKEESSSSKGYFSVQIGAFGEKKSVAYFKRRYGLGSDEIQYYQDGNLHKYSTGRFQTYEQAEKEKKQLRDEGLKGAFVIGFKGGKRVSASRLR